MDIAKLIAIAQRAVETIVPGIPATIETAQSIIEIVRDIGGTLAEDDQRALQQALPALLAKMNRDVDRAVSDLTGDA